MMNATSVPTTIAVTVVGLDEDSVTSVAEDDVLTGLSSVPVLVVIVDDDGLESDIS